jgi:hypothetical protein
LARGRCYRNHLCPAPFHWNWIAFAVWILLRQTIDSRRSRCMTGYPAIRLSGRYWLIKIPDTHAAWINSQTMDQTMSKPIQRSKARSENLALICSAVGSMESSIFFLSGPWASSPNRLAASPIFLPSFVSEPSPDRSRPEPNTTQSCKYNVSSSNFVGFFRYISQKRSACSSTFR